MSEKLLESFYKIEKNRKEEGILKKIKLDEVALTAGLKKGSLRRSRSGNSELVRLIDAFNNEIEQAMKTRDKSQCKEIADQQKTEDEKLLLMLFEFREDHVCPIDQEAFYGV